MARTRKWDVRTDRRTDRRTEGRTDVRDRQELHLMPFRYSSNRRGHKKSVHRTRMPPPNAIQKKGLYVTVTGIP